MVQKREAYAPWSLTRKAGVESATVNGDIEVPQFIQPVLSTGFVDEDGNWKGQKSSEEQFHSFGLDVGIANSGTILAPQSVTGDPPWPLDMTGYNDLFFAIRPTNGGAVAIRAVMGPATFAFANLRDVNAAGALLGSEAQAAPNDLDSLFFENDVSLVADVWNIFTIGNVLRNQKLLQFQITNNSGGSSDIETAFMRLV